MPDQRAAFVTAAIKRQSAQGTVAPGGAGATQMRLGNSDGMGVVQGFVENPEQRDDMMTGEARASGITVPGSFFLPLTVGGAVDMVMEAVWRRAWVAALVITEATGSAGALVIAASGSNFTLTRAGGSWITDGIRVGDVVTLTNHATAGNNDLRLRVVTVTALVLTVVAPTGFAAAASDATWTLTRLKKLTTVGTPVEFVHTIEQYLRDADESELFVDCYAIRLAFSFGPNAVAGLTVSFLGIDGSVLGTASSPYFTSPSLTTGQILVADDASIRHNGAEVAKFTGLTLEIGVDAEGTAVIGSRLTPAVYHNNTRVTGTISVIRSSLANISLYRAETKFDLSILLREPGTAPVGCIGLYMPSVKIRAPRAPFRSERGPMIETLQFEAYPAVATSSLDATAINAFSSAA